MNVSVVIHTCDKYEFCWKGFLYFFDKFWQNWEYPIYFCAETKTIKHPTIKNLPSGKGEWSSRLKTIIDSLDSEYIVYMQEDMWLHTSLDREVIPVLGKGMRQNDALITYITPMRFKMRDSGTLKFGQYSVKALHPRTRWIWNHQIGIRSRTFFRQQLLLDEDPWTNEIKGTKRLQKQNLVRRIYIYILSIGTTVYVDTDN